MRRRFVIPLVLMLLLSLVAPANIASAAGGPSFAATTTLVQQSPGAVTPIIDPVLGLVGFNLTGEVFAGVIDDCSGQQCGHLLGASITAVQNATIFFTGPPDAAGTVGFAGTVDGTFTLEKQTGEKAHTLDGSYNGTVFGTLTPIGGGFFLLDDDNVSTWAVTNATGKFNSLKNASGDILGELGGIFPGGESSFVTLSGDHH